MQLSSTRARVAGLALVTLLAACADAPTGLTPVPSSAAAATLYTAVTPLASRAFAGGSVRGLIAVENHNPTPIAGVATLCVSAAGSSECSSSAAHLVLPTLAEGARLVDTATFSLGAAPSEGVDVPQLVALRVCAAAAPSAAPTCATSNVIRVLPDFQHVCATSPLAVGDSALNAGVAGDCALRSTGAASHVYSVFARAGDTLSFELDANGFCGAGLAVFDRDGEIVHATTACGAPASITVPVAVGGTYHVAVGGAPAGYVLRSAYVATDFTGGDSSQP